jgi:hypothetical protein
MRGLAGSIKHFDFKAAMNDQAVTGPDFGKKIKCLMVAAHQHVLAVINLVATLGIRKRIGASAQRRPALKHCDSKSAFGQRDACTQAGKAPANYHNIARFNHSFQERISLISMITIGISIN